MRLGTAASQGWHVVTRVVQWDTAPCEKGTFSTPDAQEHSRRSANYGHTHDRHPCPCDCRGGGALPGPLSLPPQDSRAFRMAARSRATANAVRHSGRVTCATVRLRRHSRRRPSRTSRFGVVRLLIGNIGRSDRFHQRGETGAARPTGFLRRVSSPARVSASEPSYQPPRSASEERRSVSWSMRLWPART